LANAHVNRLGPHLLLVQPRPTTANLVGLVFRDSRSSVASALALQLPIFKYNKKSALVVNYNKRANSGYPLQEIKPASYYQNYEYLGEHQYKVADVSSCSIANQKNISKRIRNLGIEMEASRSARLLLPRRQTGTSSGKFLVTSNSELLRQYLYLHFF
jgi:hypothetical protein